MKLEVETMSNEMNRRKFLKLTGTVVLATSVAGALGGCGAGGSSAPTTPSPEEEGIAQIILDSINAARKEVGLDGTVQEVDKISQLSAQRALEMMKGKKHSELSAVPQEFKDGGKGYKYGGRENWTVTGFPRERFTKNQLTEDFRNNFQTVLNTPGKTTIREDVYVGIGVQEQGDYVWYDIIFDTRADKRYGFAAGRPDTETR